ncbi:hypothetical protein GWI33_007922 [Rhynchophorus ferrugineus]|uniref:Uncharacterized protein n=1 Tax=Rhynchophorus ferrugineus TaxID=354439 RepID=A0A834IDP9_RHYFE|nr:hypothetical protein GWI33_007922 [Rhynchophorus ferrugineus]
MYEESRKESTWLQEQVAHSSTQIKRETKQQTTKPDPTTGSKCPITERKRSSHNEKPKLTGTTVTDNDASNPPRKNQPLSRPWLTPTPSTSEAAKPANFKTSKQPIPKPSAEMTESTVNTRKCRFLDQKSTNTATETAISSSNATTSPSTST